MDSARGLDYAYVPSIGNVPEFVSLPQNLAALGNVRQHRRRRRPAVIRCCREEPQVAELTFAPADISSIAPSAFQELPDFSGVLR